MGLKLKKCTYLKLDILVWYISNISGHENKRDFLEKTWLEERK